MSDLGAIPPFPSGILLGPAIRSARQRLGWSLDELVKRLKVEAERANEEPKPKMARSWLWELETARHPKVLSRRHLELIGKVLKDGGLDVDTALRINEAAIRESARQAASPVASPTPPDAPSPDAPENPLSLMKQIIGLTGDQSTLIIEFFGRSRIQDPRDMEATQVLADYLEQKGRIIFVAPNINIKSDATLPLDSTSWQLLKSSLERACKKITEDIVESAKTLCDLLPSHGDRIFCIQPTTAVLSPLPHRVELRRLLFIKDQSCKSIIAADIVSFETAPNAIAAEMFAYSNSLQSNNASAVLLRAAAWRDIIMLDPKLFHNNTRANWRLLYPDGL